MYLHKENRELFKDVVLLTSERLGTAADIIEKDYYVTMILRILAKAKYTVVFKGGTSLSKAFGAIDRFSEDIDITFTEHLGANRRKRLKYEILKPVGEELGLRIGNWDSIESDKDYNHYDYCYDSVLENFIGEIQPFVKLETALMSYAFPTAEREIGNYIYAALAEDEADLMVECCLTPFVMRVQALERTLVDKIFALCDYYMLNKPGRNSRHLYDIFKLSGCVVKDDNFKRLVKEVRKHRAQMSDDIAPSAKETVDVKALINRLCEENFYKQDYENTTVHLISEDIDYDTVKNFYLAFVSDLF